MRVKDWVTKWGKGKKKVYDKREQRDENVMKNKEGSRKE